MDPARLAQVVHDASRRVEVHGAIVSAYAALQVEIDRRRPVCVVSGKCCHFENYGHRLYVTTMELAAFLREFQSRRQSAELSGSIRSWTGAGCPFQVNKLCGVHPFRPLGCRMFFCDATSTEWQNQQYEQFHSQLKLLHESMEVPYLYVEWREALEALQLAAAKT